MNQIKKLTWQAKAIAILQSLIKIKNKGTRRDGINQGNKLIASLQSINFKQNFLLMTRSFHVMSPSW